MRKLSITLLLIGISFMTMEANNYSTDHKTRIYFKKWNERQKSGQRNHRFFLSFPASNPEPPDPLGCSFPWG